MREEYELDYKEIADQFAYIIYRMMEGDEAEGLEALQAYHYLDENQEWIYEE